jgi:hypothetical protein
MWYPPGVAVRQSLCSSAGSVPAAQTTISLDGESAAERCTAPMTSPS